MTILVQSRAMRTRIGVTKTLGTVGLIASLAAILVTTGTPASAQQRRAAARATMAPPPAPNSELVLSVGRGRLVNLPVPMTDIFVASQGVADVQVRSSTQLYIFGKAPGETSIYATDASGRPVYSVIARVGNNMENIDQMLALAMPEASITVNTMNGFVLLTGTVAAPDDAAEADRLVSAFVGGNTRVISRLQTATPLQVNLQVRIAEVNRSVIKSIGGNLTSSQANADGIVFGAYRGRGAGTISYTTPPTRPAPGIANGTEYYDPFTGRTITGPEQFRVVNNIARAASVTTLGLGGRLFGLDLLGTLDIAETSGLVTTLAQPNLTTISGETADFLAGGEYPVPIPDPASGSITISYKKYGVSLSYTPTVLANGRISLRVKPEVSELSTEGAVTVNGITVPALTVRRAETTVELGSGESFMIAGLMSNRSIGSIERTPGAADIPILGTLFKSDSFRRGDTELVIVVTPYLVRPVNANDIVLPTDGYRSPTDIQRILLNHDTDGVSGGQRPMPTIETEGAASDGSAAPLPSPGMSGGQAAAEPPRNSRRNRRASTEATPGFSFRR